MHFNRYRGNNVDGGVEWKELIPDLQEENDTAQKHAQRSPRDPDEHPFSHK